MGRFLLGSTVVMLFPKGDAALQPGVGAGRPVRLGEAMAELGAGKLTPCAPSSSTPTRRCAARRAIGAARTARARDRVRRRRHRAGGAARRARRRADRGHRPHRAADRDRAPLHRPAPRRLPRHRRAQLHGPGGAGGARHRGAHHQGLRRHRGRRVRDRPAVRRGAQASRRWTAAMRDGQWLRSEGMQLTGKTLGLIGFGGIAAEMARLAQRHRHEGAGLEPPAEGASPASSSSRSSGCWPRATRSRCTCC